MVLYEVHYRTESIIQILVPIIIAVGWFYVPRYIVREQQQIVDKHPKKWLFFRIIRIPVITISLFLAIGALEYDIYMYNIAKEAYDQGAYEIVEGHVENFIPMPASGHSKESFEIKGVRFEYSENSISSGYSKTKYHGGVIRENGQYLKIGYIRDSDYGNGNIILYIEEVSSIE